jgi:hypothetical protein
MKKHFILVGALVASTLMYSCQRHDYNEGPGGSTSNSTAGGSSSTGNISSNPSMTGSDSAVQRSN